jgi:succinyl-diaminopimelate desuccinylase
MSNRDYLGDPVELARALVQIDTCNPPGNEERCVALLGPMLEKAGFSVRLHEFKPGRAGLIATGKNARCGSICFTGHLDTVPLGNSSWSVDPFGAVIEYGRLYGRGSCDMKGGVAAMVMAAMDYAKSAPEDNWPTLVFTVGEETGCEGAIAIAEELRSIAPARALVVGEPTSNDPYIGHKGALWLKCWSHGRTAHGSMPHLGDNAVVRIARAIAALDEYDFACSPHPVLGAPTINIGITQGGENFNSVPDYAFFGIDIRTLPQQDHDAIQADISRRLGSNINLKRIVDLPGIATDRGNTFVSRVFELVESAKGNMPQVCGAPYFTDGSVLKSALGDPPTIILGPGDPAMAHKTDEYCLVEEIIEARDLYRQIMALSDEMQYLQG